MKFKILILILITVLFFYGNLLSEELPFGSYGLPGWVTPADEFEIMHDSMGLNYFWNHLTISQIQDLTAAGITNIYAGGNDAIAKNTNHYYAKFQAEDSVGSVRMYECEGDGFGTIGNTGYWQSDYDSGMLFGPNSQVNSCENPKNYIKLEREYPTAAYETGVVLYWASLRLKIDSVYTDSDPNGYDTVAFFNATFSTWQYWPRDTTTLMVLTASDFNSDDTFQEFEIYEDFSLPATAEVCTLSQAGDCHPDSTWHWITEDQTEGVTFIIETTDKRKVSVDWLEVYDRRGYDLVNTNTYSSDIAANAATYSGLGDDIWGWYVRDEPYIYNLPVMGAILDTIRGRDGSIDWQFITALNYPQYYEYWFENVNTNVITPDPYPFTQATASDSVYYTGFDDAITWHYPSKYFQNRLQTIGERCERAYNAAKDDDSSNELWVIPQCFWGFEASGVNWRKPSAAELKCQTYMALASGAKGLIFWKYGVSNCPAEDRQIEGMYDCNEDRTDLWTTTAYSINPYVKAIDDVLMELNLVQSYYLSPEIGMDSTASSTYLDSISVVPDTTNPDLGWFEIGEFTETGTTDKFIFLVNRACSQSPTDSSAAPTITATVKFDASVLGLGDYIYVIDIADSIDYVNYDTVSYWSDTTFCSVSGGQFTYTTDFGPGEGRLFKLVEIEDDFPSPVTDSLDWGAHLYLKEDIVIDTNGILVIEPGTVFRVQPDSGWEIIVKGKLYVNGTESDSVIITSLSEETGIPQEGDWQGIYFDNDSEGSFKYSSVRYADNGIEMRNDTEVVIDSCNISHNETSGIYNYKGYLNLSYSDIDYNGTYGLYGLNAVDTVTRSSFYGNGTYGIRISGTTSSNEDSYIDYTTVSYPSGENDTQYGIYVQNTDYADISRTTISNYEQGGIKIYNSDVDMDKVDCTNNNYYGLLADYYSTGDITNSNFDSTVIGVKATSYANVDLGDTSATDGNNTFVGCSSYFIYFNNPLIFTQDTLMAQMNWFGSSRPNPSKFYTDGPRTIVYNPVLSAAPKLLVDELLPVQFALHQNYPNPFNPTTIIEFDLVDPAYTVVMVYNILGQMVDRPLNQHLHAGSHLIRWDGKNSRGEPVASGVYFYTIQSGENYDSRKMLLLR